MPTYFRYRKKQNPNEMKNNLQYQFFEASVNAANSKNIINDTANPILQIDNF